MLHKWSSPRSPSGNDTLLGARKHGVPGGPCQEGRARRAYSWESVQRLTEGSRQLLRTAVPGARSTRLVQEDTPQRGPSLPAISGTVSKVPAGKPASQHTGLLPAVQRSLTRDAASPSGGIFTITNTVWQHNRNFTFIRF